MNLFLFFLLSQSSVAMALDATSKIVGKLGMVRGTVLMNDKPTKNGVDVREGAVVEVKEGQATLLLGKGSVIHLASNSKMSVNEFGVSPQGEAGSLDLKFGRTRALILNQDNEKKDIKIKARAATMGVRGTEIFISVPQEASKPVEFFTLEGKAEVSTPGAAAPHVVNQNEGVTTGSAQGSSSQGSSAQGSSAQGSAQVSQSTTSGEQMRAKVQSEGMAPPPIRNFQDAEAAAAGHSPGQPPPGGPNNGYLSDQFGMGAIPNVQFDPLAEGTRMIQVNPSFCSVTDPNCH